MGPCVGSHRQWGATVAEPSAGCLQYKHRSTHQHLCLFKTHHFCCSSQKSSNNYGYPSLTHFQVLITTWVFASQTANLACYSKFRTVLFIFGM